MIGLRFPDSHALRVVLGLVPEPHQAHGGDVLAEEDGALTLRVPSLPTEVLDALTEAGVEQIEPPEGGRPFLHWVELVPLERDVDPDLREVLFVLPAGASWLGLAAELVRLGCDDLRLARLDGPPRWAVRAHRPPLYTVVKAADGAWEAFTRGPVPGAWLRAGSQHPFASRLTVPDDALLLISSPGWEVASVAGWVELGAHLVLHVPTPAPVTPTPPSESLEVTLRLVPSRAGTSPTLWRGTDVRSLVRRLPESVIERLEVAFFEGQSGSEDPAQTVIRARPGESPPVLEGLTAFVAHPHHRALFVPAAMTIDPPVSARTLRRAFDAGPDRIMWLEPRDDSFVPRTLDEAAFVPLSHHVLYEADCNAEHVDAWLASTRFDWEPLDLHVATASAAPAVAQPASAASPAATPAPAPAEAHVPAVHTQIVVAPVDLDLAPAGDHEQALQQLQQQFWATPDREDLWMPMADLHHRIGQSREAGLCWSRALWSADPLARKALAKQWADQLGTSEGLPDSERSQALNEVTARTLAGDPPVDAPTLQQWLDRRDSGLDVRARWMVRRAVAQLAGNDTLALAQARDAVLASIRTGLMPSRDAPAFLRTSSSPEELRELQRSLVRLQARALDLEAPSAPDRSRIYARLIVAWAFACLGETEPAAEALALAEPIGDDPIHQALVALYSTAIRNALAGLPIGSPPAPDVQAQLEAFDRFTIYKVDRLRARSTPLAHPGGDPTQSFVSRTHQVEPWRPDPGRPLHEELTDAVEKLHANAPIPLYNGILTSLVALPDDQAATLLEPVREAALTLPNETRVSILVDLVTAAATLRHPSHAEAVLPALREGFGALLFRDAQPNRPAELRQLSRALARCGLDAPGQVLFTHLRDAQPDDALVERLTCAGALGMVGGDVHEDLQRGLGALDQELPPHHRLDVVSSITDLTTSLPLDEAIRTWHQLVEQAALTTDNFSTAAHFGLPYLAIIDAIVAAHVHPDRLLGPEGRAWLEADEHRVRQRIHEEDSF